MNYVFIITSMIKLIERYIFNKFILKNKNFIKIGGGGTHNRREDCITNNSVYVVG